MARNDWCLLFDDDSEAWDGAIAAHVHAMEHSDAACSTGVSLAPWKTREHIPERYRRARISDVLDTGNCLRGGGDPVAFLERYPGRALTFHLKEHSKTTDKAIVGEGDVRWDDVFRLCESVGGTQWYIVEQESYAFPPLECVERCLKALRGMGK